MCGVRGMGSVTGICGIGGFCGACCGPVSTVFAAIDIDDRLQRASRGQPFQTLFDH